MQVYSNQWLVQCPKANDLEKSILKLLTAQLMKNCVRASTWILNEMLLAIYAIA